MEPTRGLSRAVMPPRFAAHLARWADNDGGDGVIVLSNDDGKKMVERDGLEPFLEEYAYVTGAELKLLAAGERPDFVCRKRGRRYGLEVVRAMQNPVDRNWDVVFGRDGQLHGLDAAILVQDVVLGSGSKVGNKR